MNETVIIGIGGGTGSGKTSIARNLLKEYGPGEVLVIELDSYYRDLADMPMDKRNQHNFDHPDSFDFTLLIQNVSELKAGKTVQMPVYDFKTHTRSGETKTVNPHHVMVIEGIFALHFQELRELMNIKAYVETPDDVRFIRRLSRDIEARGRTAQMVIDQYLSTVRPMHNQFVAPTKLFADIIIPEGGDNTVAIDLFRTKISSIINPG